MIRPSLARKPQKSPVFRGGRKNSGPAHTNSSDSNFARRSNALRKLDQRPADVVLPRRAQPGQVDRNLTARARTLGSTCGRGLAGRALLSLRASGAARSSTGPAGGAAALRPRSLADPTHQVIRELRRACLRLVHHALGVPTDRVVRHERVQPRAGGRKQEPFRTDAASASVALALCGVGDILESFRQVDYALGKLVNVCHCNSSLEKAVTNPFPGTLSPKTAVVGRRGCQPKP